MKTKCNRRRKTAVQHGQFSLGTWKPRGSSGEKNNIFAIEKRIQPFVEDSECSGGQLVAALAAVAASAMQNTSKWLDCKSGAKSHLFNLQQSLAAAATNWNELPIR